MPQQSGLRLDNRSTGLLAGLIALFAIGILVAIWLGSRGSNDEATTVDGTAPTEVGATTSTDPVVLPTVPVIPTAVETAPTSVFVTSGGATAPTTADDATADASTAGTETDAGTDSVASGFDDTTSEGGFEDESAESFPTPTAEAVAERTGDPFQFTGDATWWEVELLAGDATVATNELDFIINQDGTGSIRGTLEVSWPDGRAWSVMLDEDYSWDPTFSNVRATISNGTVTMNDAAQGAGTMAMQDPADGFGSICFAACVSFQYDPPFWSLSPDA